MTSGKAHRKLGRNDCGGSGKPKCPKSLRAAVREYEQQHQGVIDSDLNEVASQNGLASQIKYACRSVFRRRCNGNGGMHEHQVSIGYKRLNRLANACANRHADFASVRSFEEISSLILKIAKRHNIDRIGALTQYDIALRIGYVIGKLPDSVKLHAGALDGAKALFRKVGKPLPSQSALNLTTLPYPLRNMQSHHVENFLCIYKCCFKQMVLR